MLLDYNMRFVFDNDELAKVNVETTDKMELFEKVFISFLELSINQFCKGMVIVPDTVKLSHEYSEYGEDKEEPEKKKVKCTKCINYTIEPCDDDSKFSVGICTEGHELDPEQCKDFGEAGNVI